MFVREYIFDVLFAWFGDREFPLLTTALIYEMRLYDFLRYLTQPWLTMHKRNIEVENGRY